MRSLILSLMLAFVVSSPAFAKQRRIDVNDETIAYTEKGDGATAIIFIHGWMCNRQQWKGQMDALSKEYHVIAIDLPGHGGSTANRSIWTIEAFGDDIVGVIDALGLDRVILVGHSMGGPIAVEAAARRKQKIVGVVGVDTLKRPGQVMTGRQAGETLAAFGDGWTQSMSDMVRSRYFSAYADQALIDQVARDMSAALRQNPGRAKHMVRSLYTYDTRPALASIADVPLSMLNSGKGEYAEGYSQEVNNAHIIDITDTGHFPMLEQPKAFSTVLSAEILRMRGVVKYRTNTSIE